MRDVIIGDIHKCNFLGRALFFFKGNILLERICFFREIYIFLLGIIFKLIWTKLSTSKGI